MGFRVVSPESALIAMHVCAQVSEGPFMWNLFYLWGVYTQVPILLKCYRNHFNFQLNILKQFSMMRW